MATKPRTILTPGEAAAPAQPVDTVQPTGTSTEILAGAADEPSAPDVQDADGMRQRVAATEFTFPDPDPAPAQAPQAEAPAAPAQPAVQAVSNTPKLTKDGWVVPADFGAQPKRVG